MSRHPTTQDTSQATLGDTSERRPSRLTWWWKAPLGALLALLRAQHPYQVPQLLVQPLWATADYADWVRKETQDG